MKYVFSIAAALMLGAIQPQPALAQQGLDLVKQAVAAQGGADALRRLQALAIKGEAKHWEPEQSKTAGGEPRFLGDSTFTVTWDLAKGMARSDWDRNMKYPFAAKMKYSEIVTPTYGYVATGEGSSIVPVNAPTGKGNTPMSGIRVASHLRELERAAPTLLLKAMDGAKNVGAMDPQKLGKDSLAAVSYTDGGAKFTIMFDKGTHLPAAIRTRDDDNIQGDSNYDLVLGDWKPVGGVKIAHSLSYRLNDIEVGKITYKEISVNPTIAADAIASKDFVVALAKPPATSNVPYQWVLRRVALGRFTDSDAVFVPVGGSLRLSELAPTVQQAVGGTHNSLVVAMKDGLVVFDAPIGEGQSRWVIDAVKAKYPGKPIKYLVLTHHHMDHTGGARTYVAEGATVIVPTPSKAHFDKFLNQPRTIVPDAQEKNRKPVNVTEVKETMSIKDDGGEIRLYNIPNPHSDGMLIGHLVKENIVWVTDVWSPGRDVMKTPGALALAEAVKKIGITGATFAGGHGSTAKQAVLEGIVAQN